MRVGAYSEQARAIMDESDAGESISVLAIISLSLKGGRRVRRCARPRP